MLTAHIHSMESFGALDGPGIRFVVFFQGCPLHCLYCHNPDSWDAEDGRIMTLEELLSEMERFRGFIHRGGVTLSGGEPLLQYTFVRALLTELRRRGVHTAIDTSGAVPLEKARDCIDLADMLLLDIKSIDPEQCILLTGHSNRSAIETLRYCEETKKTVWIRHVLVPGYTLDPGLLERLGAFLQPFHCVERVDLLPFHKMGEYKWEELHRAYTLSEVQPPSAEEVQEAKEILLRYGLPVK